MPLPDDDLPDRFLVVVDEDAEPVDWDEALADFLLRHVRRKRATSQALSGARQSPEREHERYGAALVTPEIMPDANVNEDNLPNGVAAATAYLSKKRAK